MSSVCTNEIKYNGFTVYLGRGKVADRPVLQLRSKRGHTPGASDASFITINSSNSCDTERRGKLGDDEAATWDSEGYAMPATIGAGVTAGTLGGGATGKA